MFLPGDHTLDHTISMGTTTNITDWRGNISYQPDYYYPHPTLTLLGSPSSLPEVTSRIVCIWPAGFEFLGISELNISALAFISCGHNGSAAVNILSVQNASISNCTFQNNTNPLRSIDGNGGAIYAHLSTLVLTRDTFQSNSAGSGGALYLRQDCVLTLTESVFQNNNAAFGGGLYVNDTSLLILSNNTFQTNFVSYYGGAIDVFSNNTVILTGNIFQTNSADNGGAFYVTRNSNLTFIRNIFLNNSAKYHGGALYLLRNSVLILTENTFQNNTALEYYGGSLLADTNNTLTLTGNTFQNSFAFWGGAFQIYFYNTLILVRNIFQNNSATYGGALSLISYNTLTLKMNIFQNNFADKYGGAIFAFIGNNLRLTENTFQNCVSYQGGALYVNISNTLTLIENTFQDNSANNSAGALYVISNNTLTLKMNMFQNNFADYGGAIYVFIGNTLRLTENTFQSCAGIEGGALVVNISNTLTLTENIFQDNLANNTAAAVCVKRNNTLTLIECNFQNNSASVAGTISIGENSTMTLTRNTFQNNSANIAGAIYVGENSTMILAKNTFQNNLATSSGGTLEIRHATLTLVDNIFQNNLAGTIGGALFIYTDSTINLTMNMFQNNSAIAGGVLFVFADSTLTLTENIFYNNSALYGGVFSVYLNTILNCTGNVFQNNTAENVGGVLHTHRSTIKFANNNFSTNTAKLMGGTIFCTSNSSLSIHGSNKFWNNTAQYGGGVAALDCQILLIGTTSFENNTATYGGGLYADGLHIRGSADFTNNLASNDGGGVYASRSVFSFKQESNFLGNSALNNGGGIFLTGDSKLYFQPNSNIRFISNHAKQKGGALMIEESKSFSSCAELSCEYLTGSDCFFQIQTQSVYDISTPVSNITEVYNIRIYFENNSALEAGPTLYGGFIDKCSLHMFNQHRIYGRGQGLVGFSPYLCPNISQVFDYLTGYKPLNISSDPLYICTCNDSEPDCSSSTISMSVYPGGSIEVPIIAYGQRNGTTPAVIHNITPKGKITFNDIENTQNTTTKCTLLKYTVKTQAVDTSQEVSLYAESPCPPKERTVSSVPTNVLTVHLKVLPCPPGFELSEIPPACICAQRLKLFTNECQIDNKAVQHDTDFWVGYTATDHFEGLILHPHCPFDYCLSSNTYIRVDDSDTQCTNNRSGILCGKCSQNFSLALGSTRCLQCPNNYLWLLVAFAVAGLALVFLLIVLNLTVAAGTINGLVFYANILAVNSATFFRPQTTNILTVFIAWINLDLGIETCFYDGMDTYAKTWLQFVFPLYVWALVIGIITVSHYSIRISTILSNNTIAVLATLILLSYAKLLRTVIAIFSYTLLEYPNNSQAAVWLHDGNIRYLSSKHTPLFIAAVVCLVVLFLPYTLLLLFGQWIQKSKWKIVCLLNNYRVLFFREAYHAPYMVKHRYWTGLMLLCRCALFFIFAFNALGDPNINLLCITSATVGLLVLNSLLGNKIYKTRSLNILDLSFIANLCVLATATLYIRKASAGDNQNAAAFTSISVAFATFIGIVIYHLVQQLKEAPRWWRRVHPSQSEHYNPVPQTAADTVSQGRALHSPVDPSCAQFASITYINLNELVREQLQEL